MSSISSRPLSTRSLTSRPLPPRPLPSNEISPITSVQVPFLASPSPPSTPKLTAETPILATTSRQATPSRQARAVRFSPLPSTMRHMLPPDDLQPTPTPSLSSRTAIRASNPLLGRTATHTSTASSSGLRRSVSPLTDISESNLDSTLVFDSPNASPDTSLSESDSDSRSDLGSETSSRESFDLLYPKVEKPDGEVGRPGRGGYNLLAALAWDRKTYNEVRNYVNKRCERHLNCSVPYTAQRRENISAVVSDALKEYNDLKQYSKSWPVHDLIKSHLKYANNKARRDQIAKEAKEAREAKEAKAAKAEMKARKMGHRRSPRSQRNLNTANGSFA